MSDDKVVSFQDHVTQLQSVEPPHVDELNCQRVRDLAAKAVIYPQMMNRTETQELGAAVLSHLKRYYGCSDS